MSKVDFAFSEEGFFPPLQFLITYFFLRFSAEYEIVINELRNRLLHKKPISVSIKNFFIPHYSSISLNASVTQFSSKFQILTNCKWRIIRNNVTKSGAPGNRTPLKKCIYLQDKLIFRRPLQAKSNNSCLSSCYKFCQIRFKIVRTFHYFTIFIIYRFTI